MLANDPIARAFILGKKKCIYNIYTFFIIYIQIIIVIIILPIITFAVAVVGETTTTLL